MTKSDEFKLTKSEIKRLKTEGKQTDASIVEWVKGLTAQDKQDIINSRAIAKAKKRGFHVQI